MAFTPDQVTEVFKSLGRIEARLESGDEKFKGVERRQENFAATTTKIDTHIDHHKSVVNVVKWGMYIVTFCSSIWGGWFAWLRFKQ